MAAALPVSTLRRNVYFAPILTSAKPVPFWIGDLVKTSLVAMIAAEVHRAFPQLLHRD